MLIRLTISALVACTALLGCDPGTTLEGKLTAPDGGAVVGATVQTVCADQSGAMSAVSDGNGHFEAHGLGCVNETCRLEVVVPGKAPVVLPVEKHCRGTVFACGRLPHCSQLEVNTVVE
jgi:hypothetical protein